ncbi:MAG: LytTR family DNA-binding domain-containing protein [Thermoflavifilum sp.]|nr:LytTR family DNA-binding domain-containing protein [Thermoflavifilum sp.]
MASVNCYIIDDEFRSIRLIKSMLKDHFPEINMIGSQTDAQLALMQVKQLLPDLLFLDIHMPDLDGFTLLNMIGQYNPEVVFVTAYHEYALQAFDVRAAGYLTKPVQTEKFIECVHHVVERIQLKKNALPLQLEQHLPLQSNEKKKIMLPVGKERLLVYPAEIVYLESEGNYTHIHLFEQRHVLVCKQIGQLQQELATYSLVRVHHRYVVNLTHVARYVAGASSYVILRNGVKIPISRRQKEDFLKALHEYTHSQNQR